MLRHDNHKRIAGMFAAQATEGSEGATEQGGTPAAIADAPSYGSGAKNES